MPATYAHHRFGNLVFQSLPAEVKRTAQRFRQLYDLGQHGPDLFFYYNPLFHTRMGELGHQYHYITGKALFEAACERLRQTPSEGGEAYLFGLLGHFVLDSACHPYVRALSSEGHVGHTELETELDRHLLTVDGREPACSQNLGSHVRATWGECVTVSQFYPPASAYTIRHSVRMIRIINRLQAMKNRKVPETIFRLGGKSASEMVMYTRPNHRCAPFLDQLNQLFEDARERYPGMAAQLEACLRDSTPLGTDFEVTFG